MRDAVQTKGSARARMVYMDSLEEVHIDAAELLSKGLVLRFGDGRCAFYPAVLLRSFFSEAEELDEESILW